MAFAPGEKIGNLHVECELGAGSFATVYRARDELVGRTVAVKVLHPPARSAVPVDRERVLGEARVVGALSSPHVVTLYGVRELADGGFAFEMEYVDGGSLEDLLERESRPAREDVIRILGGILRGLEAAHRDGILHLDVKPANVLLGADGSVKLGDFGVAGNLGEGGLESVTGGALRGTPQYMAPEVFHEEPVTVATDLWSVGIVLYRMLCGRLPFTGGLPALFYAVPYAEPEALGPDVDSNLGGLALRCLAKAPEDRPASCSDLLEILERIASAPQAPAPPRPAVVQARGPLVGRARELRRLEGLAARAEAGDGGTVVVSGEGGIGKTRLLQELRRRTQHGGFRWLDATLGPVGGLQGALLEAVRRGLHPGPTATVGAAWVTTARFGPAAGVLRKLLAGDEGAHPDRSSYVMWALEQLLLGLAGEGPVGVLIEEARLAGVEDHRLLRGLSARLAGQRILLTLAIRTHDAHTEEEPGRALLAALAGLPHVVRMDLGPL
ncbi:MAG: serine/threonine-protein kinase, partial [Planctomycetota bacterium]